MIFCLHLLHADNNQPQGMIDSMNIAHFIDWIEAMKLNLGIPRGFSQIREEDIPQMAKHAARKCNPLYPVLMNRKELKAVYYELMEEPR